MIESENIVKAVRWLGKFRIRLTAVILIPLLCAVGMYFISDYILEIITIPLNGQSLFYMTPVEGIMAKIKISFWCGLVISFPIIIYLIASMFAAHLKKSTKRKIYFLVIPFSTIALVGGITFGYMLILPITIEFLLNSASDFMKPMLSGSNYVSFTAFFLLALGLVFELPLFLIGLSRLGIIKYKMLKAKRPVAIMVIFIVMAILSPTPDAFTLLALSLPVVLLFEVSVWWIFMFERLDIRRVKEK
jgi:sec-independent protein translocase protein TatC